MSSFNSAFASARSAGKKTFSWNGKLYTTQTKEEAERKSPPANPPKPVPRPSSAPTSNVPLPPRRPSSAPTSNVPTPPRRPAQPRSTTQPPVRNGAGNDAQTNPGSKPPTRANAPATRSDTALGRAVGSISNALRSLGPRVQNGVRNANRASRTGDVRPPVSQATREAVARASDRDRVARAERSAEERRRSRRGRNDR